MDHEVMHYFLYRTRMRSFQPMARHEEKKRTEISILLIKRGIQNTYNSKKTREFSRVVKVSLT